MKKLILVLVLSLIGLTNLKAQRGGFHGGYHGGGFNGGYHSYYGGFHNNSYNYGYNNNRIFNRYNGGYYRGPRFRYYVPIWIPGYWTIDPYGNQLWVNGYYR
jgi:hypothetical protein